MSKAGFVTIVGTPNVGKSTLLNRLVGTKLAAVSPKPQTTRQTVRGILTEERGQIVFLDTPGLHKPRDAYSERMVKDAQKSYMETDVIYWMVFPKTPSKEEFAIGETLQKLSTPIFLLVNKVDTISKPELLPILDFYNKSFNCHALFPISAMHRDNLPELLNKTFERLPEHPPYFPDDQSSSHTERFIATEMIREKIFRLANQEVPYSVAVEINDFKEKNERLVVIEATIYVERDSQKGILVGEGGKMIKLIGKNARQDIEIFLGKKIFLQLWVKERKDWKKDEHFLDQLEKEGDAAA